MATGTNAIALESEVKSITGSSASVTTNKCCTKSRAITLGADSSYLSSYTNDLLVKYSSVVKYEPPVTTYRNINAHVTFVFTSTYNLLSGSGTTLDMYYNYYIKGYFGNIRLEIDTKYISYHGTSNLYLLSGSTWIATSKGKYCSTYEPFVNKVEANLINKSICVDMDTTTPEVFGVETGVGVYADTLMNSFAIDIWNSSNNSVLSFNFDSFVIYASVNTMYNSWSDLKPADLVYIGSNIDNVKYVIFTSQSLADYYITAGGQSSEYDYEY